MFFQKIDKIEIFFLDRINIGSLVLICRNIWTLRTIWYFDSNSVIAMRLISILRQIGILKADIRQVPYHIGEVRNRFGQSQYAEMYKDVMKICERIRNKEIVGHPLIQGLKEIWSVSKVEFYFEKLAELHTPGYIYLECLRICLTSWMQEHMKLEKSTCRLLIQRKKWFPYLNSYAHNKGVHLIGLHRFDFYGVIHIVKQLYRMLGRAGQQIISLIRSNSPTTKKGTDLKLKMNSNGKPKIGIVYTGGKISFNPVERSDFFWIWGLDLPFSSFLMYNYSGIHHLPKDVVNDIHAHKLTVYGNATGFPTWRSTTDMLFTYLRVVKIILLSWTRCVMGGNWVSLYYILSLLKLARDYAYWYDFYSAQNIKLNISITNWTTVGQVLALDSLNGLSIAYQHSISNIFPTTFISSGENVQFVFSDQFKALWQSIEAPVDRYIKTGFIHDNSAQAVRYSDRILKTRAQLKDNGAQFMICFFDENSIDRWDLPAPHKQAARDYEFLLQWLLNDDTLGIVFKPKRSHNLFERLSSIADLIEQARVTGRCVFLTSNATVGSIYPAEAALISNLCIGKLSGATAAFEAQLTGVPTLLIDSEGFDWHPFYNWGDGQIIFNNWETLRRKVEDFRSDQRRFSKLGDWSDGIHYLDTFQDGKACVRMGSFIRWTFNQLAIGVPKRDALETAVKRYEKRWGTQA